MESVCSISGTYVAFLQHGILSSTVTVRFERQGCNTTHMFAHAQGGIIYTARCHIRSAHATHKRLR